MLPQNNPGRIRVVFDDHGLVANGRLMLPPTLAQHLGLRELVHHHLDLGGAPGRANTGDNMLTLAVSALATGNCIANADARRAGGTAGPFPASSGLVVTSAWFARWPTPADMPLWASIERGRTLQTPYPRWYWARLPTGHAPCRGRNFHSNPRGCGGPAYCSAFLRSPLVVSHTKGVVPRTGRPSLCAASLAAGSRPRSCRVALTWFERWPWPPCPVCSQRAPAASPHPERSVAGVSGSRLPGRGPRTARTSAARVMRRMGRNRGEG